jgi:hypothetical protein
MPESSSRKKTTKPAATQNSGASKNADQPNPSWYAPVMLSFLVLGLVWIIVYYVSSAQFPLGSGTPFNIQNWNIAVGFGIAMVGFIMTTRWK